MQMSRYLQVCLLLKHLSSKIFNMYAFSGDVNHLPYLGKKQPYSILTTLMTDSLVDKYPGASWHPKFATYNNEHNTYSHGSPERIDYLMYWASPEISMCTLHFDSPKFYTSNNSGRNISISDHDPLSAVFSIERRQKTDSCDVPTMAPRCEKDFSYTRGLKTIPISPSLHTI